jgi:hypothetical protein
VLGSTTLKNTGKDVTPHFFIFEFFCGRVGEFFCYFNDLGFLILFIESFRANDRRVENSGKLCAQKVSLLSWESGVWFNISIEVTSHDCLDVSCCNNVLGSNVGKLAPVIIQIVIHPENELIDTLTTKINSSLSWLWVSNVSTHDPVVLSLAHDFTSEFHVVGSTLNGKPLDWLLKFVRFWGSKVDTSPVEHLEFLAKISDVETRFLNCYKFLVAFRDF